MISVIVPVYNAEKTIRRCVDSILSQTYTELEVLLIDDGATDAAVQIIDEYAAKDSRVTAVHKPNGGTASARNMGLSMAKGEFIGFADDDDYLHPQMYEKLLLGFENPAVDIAMCQLKEVFELEKRSMECIEKKNIKFPRNTPDAQIIDRETAITEYFYIQLFSVAVWDKLFKRELFENVRFDTKNYYEDKRISFELLTAAKSVYVSTDYLYFYYVHNASKARTIRASNLQDFVRISEEILAIVQQQYPHLEDLAKYRIAKDNLSIAQWILEKDEFAAILQSSKNKMRKYAKSFLRNKRTSSSNKLLFVFIAYFGFWAKLLKKTSRAIRKK